MRFRAQTRADGGALCAKPQASAARQRAGSYAQDWLLHDTDFNWRVLAEEAGALRAVADIGTHWLDLVQSMTGMYVPEVCADLKTV